MLMEDISSSASVGVDGVDPYGREIRIFLDPENFFGDYPAASLNADAVGNTGYVSCTHFTVMR